MQGTKVSDVKAKPSKLLSAAIAALELIMLDENGQLHIDTSENVETETEVFAVRGMLQVAIAEEIGDCRSAAPPEELPNGRTPTETASRWDADGRLHERTDDDAQH